MLIFTFPSLVPILLGFGTYYLFELFLDDVNAFGVAAIVGSAVSALMEFAGFRATVFFFPVGVWLAFGALDTAFGIMSSPLLDFAATPGIGIAIMAVVTALFGLLSLLGMFIARGPADEDDEGDAFMHDDPLS